MKKLLCAFFLLLAAVRLQAVNPVPFTESVDFSFEIAGTGTAIMTVYDETGSQAIMATASGTTIESGTGTVSLCPGKTYNIDFWGGGPSSYQMSFVEPVGYTVYINGVAADEAGNSGGSWFLHFYTVEIRPTSAQTGGMWGSFSGIAVGKSITWSVGLGDLRTGRSAGAIEFKQQDLSNNPTSRDRLYYAAPPANVGQIVVVNDGPSNLTLRQICTPIGFTDLVDVTGGYEIRCYSWGQVTGWTGTLYTFSGSPWKTIKVESPASSQLKITETEGSVVRVSNLTGTSSSVATGGTVTTSGGYTIHTFNSGGSFVASSDLSYVDYLVVGGGGGGGFSGGGGGASSVEILTHQSINSGTYSVTIGSGGPSDTNGNNSSFNGTTGYGGGHGASYLAAPAAGGSSGGGCANNNTGGPPTSGSGSNIHWGGSGDNGSYGWYGGGGGGAGTNGHGVGEGASTGLGGDGISNSYSGSATYYGGGGGGCANGNPAGRAGGLGGGGLGSGNSTGGDGTANTGSGGGAGCGYAGGTGGSGVVIIRYNTMLSTGAYTWTLQEGDGTTVLRTTTHESTVPTAGQRDDVVIVRTGDATGTIVAKTKYHYVTQAWGEELDSVIADPDTTALTTSYDYYTTSTDLGNYRRVKSVTLPTGGWTRYEYYDDYDRRGQLKYQYQPWLDTPSAASSATTTNCHTFYYEYTADWTGRYTRPTLREERINNTLVGKTTWSVGDNTGSGEPRAYMTVNSYRDGSNYQSDYIESYRADADPDFAGDLYQSKAASQAQDSVSISRGTFDTTTKVFTVSTSGDHWREMRFHGSTSSSGADSVTSFDSQSCPAVYMIPNQSTIDVTIRIAQGYVYRTATYVYAGSGSFSLMTYTDFDYDGNGHLTQRWDSNGALVNNSFTDGQLLVSTDPSGIETDYTYDEIGRMATSIKKGASASGSYAAQGDITTTYTYDGANNVTQTVVGGGSGGGALSLTSSAAYDLAGRPSSSTAPGSYTTSYAYSSGGCIVTATLPGGATKIVEVYPDGQAKSLTGTAQVAQYTSYTLNTTPGTVTKQTTFGTSTSTALVKDTTDWLGRPLTEVKPGWNGSDVTKSWTYGSAGLLTTLSQPGLADTLYDYDTMGVLYQECLDVSGNGAIDAASTDRITTHVWTYFSSSSNWWLRNSTVMFATNGSSTGTVVAKTETQLSGFATNRFSLVNSYDVFGNVTSKYMDVSRAGKTATVTTDVPDSTTNVVQVAYNGLAVSSSDAAGNTTTAGYDVLGRPTTTTDPRTGTTTTAYVSGTSQPYTVTDPASVVQATYTYDSAGRVATLTNALSKVCRYEYTNRNEKYHVWGDTDYPVEYGYDSWGHQTTMSTYRAGTGWTGSTWPTSTTGTADTTTWAFQEATGLLSSKIDATTTNSVNYTYTQAGQILTRAWARTVTVGAHIGDPVTTTYAYSGDTGELQTVTYNDGLSYNLTYTYNRLGQMASVADRTGTHNFGYNLTGTLELQNETFSTDYYGTGRQLTYTYATSGMVGQPTGFGVGTSTSYNADQSVAYSYDSGTGRLSSVAGGGQTFTYGYASNSNLVGTVTNGSYVDTRTYNASHDWISDRKTAISTAIRAEFAYTPDNLGHTTQVAKTSDSGGLYDRYGNGTEGLTTYYTYDALSQLKSEVTKVGTSSTVLAGRNDSDYSYDTIGNRSSTTHNGNTASYTTNSLNQYTARDVPGVFDVAGASTLTTIHVSSSGGANDLATRSGNYFFDGYGLTNTGSPVFSTLTIAGSGGGTSSATLDAYVAETPEFTSTSYDADGNLTSDGHWSYTYDAENRLITAETNGAAIAANVPRQKLTFGYDYLGRRVLKGRESNWNSSTSTYDTTDYWLRYLYNGWNPVAEVDSDNNCVITKNFLWGLDLAGPGQTAGGVGALLMTQEGSNSYLPIYDGNGNIHGMITAGSVTLGGTAYSAGDIVAAYEYDAFGNTLRESGDYAASNPFRYSTKFTDVETGLLYYGLRYYSPSMARFINRDPIEEQGGINLYAFCRNNGVNGYDVLGQDAFMVVVGTYPDGGPMWAEGDDPSGLDRSNAFVSSLTTNAVGVEPNSKTTNEWGENYDGSNTVGGSPTWQFTGGSIISAIFGTTPEGHVNVGTPVFIGYSSTADSGVQKPTANPAPQIDPSPVQTKTEAPNSAAPQDPSIWSGVGTAAGHGFLAALDGANPFGNPFANRGYYNPNEPGLNISKGIGTYVVAPAATIATGAAIWGAARGSAAAGTAAETGSMDAASSLQGSLLRQQLAAEEAAGVRAPTSISSWSDHVLEQAAGRDGGLGVSRNALEDAFNSPTTIEYAPSKFGPTFRYTGNNGTVVVNPQGNVVTGWATNSGGLP